MEDLKNIIKEIKAIPKFKPSDDTILECSTRIFNTMNMQGNTRPTVPDKGDTPATEKQISYLKKLMGEDFRTEGLTKVEASKLIEEAKREQRG